jgi:hypothetical protein
MSSLGNSYFTPPGPKIPSDSHTSKSKIDGMTYPQTKLVLPIYADTADVVVPVAGMLIFNSTTGKLNFYNGTAWEAVTSV